MNKIAPIILLSFLCAFGAELVRYVVCTEGNSPGGDGTTTDTTGANRAWASLSEAEAALDNAYNGDYVSLYCTSPHGADDTLYVNFNGATFTDPDVDYIKIIGEVSTAVWNDDIYSLVVNNDDCIVVWDDAIRLEKLQIRVAVTDGNAENNIDIAAISAGGIIKIDKCILRQHDNDSYTSNGIKINDADVTVYIWNNLIYDGSDNASYSNAGIFNQAGTSYIYYNTVVDFCVCVNNAGTSILKNNVVSSSTLSNIYNTGTLTGSDYNMSDDATNTGGAHDFSSVTFTFADTDSYDYRITDSDTGAFEKGVDLSGDGNLPVSDDIVGTTRDASTPDCGFFEYTSGGGPSQFTVTAVDSPDAGGTAAVLHSPVDSADADTVVAAVSANYHLLWWGTNADDTSTNGDTLFHSLIDENVTDTAFYGLDTFYVDTTYGANGTVTTPCADTIFAYGELCTLYVTPASGYRIVGNQDSLPDTLIWSVEKDSAVSVTFEAWPTKTIDSTIVNGIPDSVVFSDYGTVDSGITITVTIHSPADTQCTVSGDTSGILDGFSDVIDGNKSYTFTFDTIPDESPPTVTVDPSQLHDTLGQTDTVTVTATGPEPFTYQWQFYTGSWGDTAGETNDSLFYRVVLDKQGDSCRVIVTNAYGSDTSAAFEIAVLWTEPPTISTDPADTTLNTGRTAHFFIEYTGSPSTFQWQDSTVGGWSNISGATDSTIDTTANNAITGYRYRCIVTNDSASDTSVSALLTVDPFTVSFSTTGSGTASGDGDYDSLDTAFIELTPAEGWHCISDSLDTIVMVKDTIYPIEFEADANGHFYCRADGTAANKEAATGSGGASTFMTLTVASGETFSPGDTIFLGDSSHGSFFETLDVPSSGTVDSPIVIINASGEHPVISGFDDDTVPGEYDSCDRASCITISSKNYIIIQGLECRYSGGTGSLDGECIRISGTSTGIIIQNCNVHHNENEALKLWNTSSVTSNNNRFHDNIDSDVSQHDTTIWTSNYDTLYNSPYGIENIGRSHCTFNNGYIYNFTTAGIYLYLNYPYIEVNGGLINSNSSVLNGISILDNSSADIDGITIQRCYTGILLQHGSDTSTITNCEFDSCVNYGVDANSGLLAIVNDNSFNGTLPYGIRKTGSLTELRSYRNLFTDFNGGGVYSRGYSLNGLFYCAGNVHNGSAGHVYYIAGTANANSTIANNYINGAGAGSNGIYASSLTFKIYNNAVRNSGGNNYQLISNCSVISNISNKADLPSDSGNINSATFTNIYQSIDPSNENYAVPITDSAADGAGIDPGMASFTTYYNDTVFNVEQVDIGAMGNGDTIPDETPVSITLDPVQQYDSLGEVDTVFVTATGTAPISYQWQFWRGSWSDTTGATNDSIFYLLSDTSLAGDSCRCVVSNAYGGDTSVAFEIDVNYSPVVVDSIRPSPQYSSDSCSIYLHSGRASGTVTDITADSVLTPKYYSDTQIDFYTAGWSRGWHGIEIENELGLKDTEYVRIAIPRKVE